MISDQFLDRSGSPRESRDERAFTDPSTSKVLDEFGDSHCIGADVIRTPKR